jgi:hypothetical protein
MTKKNGLKNYLLKLKNKGKINNETYNIAIVNIDHLNLMQMYYKNMKNNFLQRETTYKTIDSNNLDDSSQFNFDDYFENYSKKKNEDKNVKMSKFDYQILQVFGNDLITKKDSNFKKSITNIINEEIGNKHYMKNYYNPFFRTIGNIIYENSENGKNNSLEMEMNSFSDNIIENDNDNVNSNNNENNNDFNNDNDDDIENKNIISLENNDNNKIDNKINKINSNSNSKNNNKNIIINDINDNNNLGSKKSSNRTIYTVQTEPKVKQIPKHETPRLIKSEYSENN